MLHHLKKVLAGVAAVGALALGGSAIAGAATSHGTSSTNSTSASNSSRPAMPANFPAHGTAAHEDAEKTVTGAAAAKAQAAAVRLVGGGTAGAVTTDYTGRGYETSVTKSDGSKVEVHLDSSFNALQAPSGGHGAPPTSGYSG